MGNIFRKPQNKNCKNEVQKIKKIQSKTRKSIQSPRHDIVQEIFGSNVTKQDNQYLICNTKFAIKEDILLYNLIGCDDMTGKEILNKIIKIADRLNKNIELSDSSYKIFETMKCTYSLSHFHILLHGESWYNKFGFKSKTHEEDKLHNEKIRNLPLHEFIQMAKDIYIKKELRELDMDCDVMNRRPFLYKELQYESVDSYKTIKKEEIMRTNLLDVDDFITAFGNTFDEHTKVSSIILDIFKNYIEKEKPTLCDRKIKLLKQFIDSSRFVLKYSRVLIREPRTITRTRIKSPF